ncbi:MAG TPA: type II toxin-antitoxin system RelE/ParE family toxin [Dermatophilaceae bacterium]|nr:type II toxin-antitoxin system RelE/ParE family toxin [Dermatophilaceae bacterium]
MEFLTGALVQNPARVGKPLRGELAGIRSARLGTYRVLYRINEGLREVVVLRIDHRRDVYPPPLTSALAMGPRRRLPTRLHNDPTTVEVPRLRATPRP